MLDIWLAISAFYLLVGLLFTAVFVLLIEVPSPRALHPKGRIVLVLFVLFWPLGLLVLLWERIFQLRNR